MKLTTPRDPPLGPVLGWGTRDFGLLADGTLGFVSPPTGPAGCP